MLKNHISAKIREALQYEPTLGQEELIQKWADYVVSPVENEIFLLKGYAGTGKTTMVNALVKTLDVMKMKSVLLAPTGRAAKVLSTYTGKSAYTIHKKIYRQKSSTDGFGKFALDRNLSSFTFFIVDEASMISNYSPEGSIFGSGRLLDDLVEYVYSGRNCKLILIGDTAQLPPVGLDVSPALDVNELEACFGMDVQHCQLRDVVRQSEESGILSNATHLREKLMETDPGYPSLKLSGFPDVERIQGGDLIETISSAHYQYGMEETMVVSRSNKRANRFNQGIRNMILYREEEISPGDYLMVVKNNYFWTSDVKEMDFIANGDIVEVVRILRHIELYGFRFAEITVRFPDYKDVEIDVMILLDTLDIETASLDFEESKRLFSAVAEDYMDIPSKKKRYEKIRVNPYFNALQVKFAYAVTCHKAQGGQWSAVFVDQGYLTEDMLDREYYRWMYTAITRATEKLYLVNFKQEFFPDEPEL
ncbi:MAG: ATP-dependent RecD-like DNA helicase [Marinifilaceae bacterium]